MSADEKTGNIWSNRLARAVLGTGLRGSAPISDFFSALSWLSFMVSSLGKHIISRLRPRVAANALGVSCGGRPTVVRTWRRVRSHACDTSGERRSRSHLEGSCPASLHESTQIRRGVARTLRCARTLSRHDLRHSPAEALRSSRLRSPPTRISAQPHRPAGRNAGIRRDRVVMEVSGLSARIVHPRSPTRAVLLGGEAGLRCGEIMALEWVDVDLSKRQLCSQQSDWKGHVTATKGGRLRYVPLTCGGQWRYGSTDICEAPAWSVSLMARH